MAATEEDVKPGVFFLTPSRQIRKVTMVAAPPGKKKKVHYIAKSANNKNRPFAHGHVSPKVLVAEMPSFLSDCGRLLSAAEVEKLRREQVILKDE